LFNHQTHSGEYQSGQMWRGVWADQDGTLLGGWRGGEFFPGRDAAGSVLPQLAGTPQPTQLLEDQAPESEDGEPARPASQPLIAVQSGTMHRILRFPAPPPSSTAGAGTPGASTFPEPPPAPEPEPAPGLAPTGDAVAVETAAVDPAAPEIPWPGALRAASAAPAQAEAETPTEAPAEAEALAPAPVEAETPTEAPAEAEASDAPEEVLEEVLEASEGAPA
jgi:hypothetical protein